MWALKLIGYGASNYICYNITKSWYAEDESLHWSLSFEPNDVTHPYLQVWHSTEANESVGLKVSGLWGFKLCLLEYIVL